MDIYRNQIQQADFIKNKFSTYLKSIFGIRDHEYDLLYKQRLSDLETKLYKGPFLASTLPFEQGRSIRTLIQEGVFEEEFMRVSNIDFDRPCYKHQEKAFEGIKTGRNIVVTTGTGSGKTECFLFPIINELISEIKHGKPTSGIRAIMMFPLNALVYDQIDRLRKLLSGLPDIRFGFYTGNTPEDESSPDYFQKFNQYKSQYGDPLQNEVITRKAMKDNPPQILFTNYSMLEYLLIRPTDESIISTEALKNLRFVVLDEAHNYRGAVGIEVSLLLRRLLGVANKKIQYVLTSATLGRGREDLYEIIDFASKLTSSGFSEDDVIFGMRHQFDVVAEYTIAPSNYLKLLASLNNEQEFEYNFNQCSYLEYNKALSARVNLYNLLLKDNNCRKLFELTKDVGDFNSVLLKMDEFSCEMLIALIDLIQKSISSDTKYNLKLFDIKYHMFVKAPDGAYITLGKKKDLSLLTVNQINGKKAFKIGICQNCKTPYIMGIIENNILCIDDEIDIDESYADRARKLEYYLIGDCLSDDEKNNLEKNKKFKKYKICTQCGFIKPSNDVSNIECEHFDCNSAILYKYIGEGKADDDDYDDDTITNNLHHCPICDYKSNSGGVIMGFHVGKDRATTLIAQILYESMNYPSIPIPNQNGLTKIGSVIRKGKKQFLAFSDGRQQAAFFSKFLNANNDKFLKKSILLKTLKDSEYKSISYSELVDKLEKEFRKLFHYEEEARKHARATALWELFLVDGRNSGEGLGLYAFTIDFSTCKEHSLLIQDNELEQVLKDYNYDNLTSKQFRDIVCQVFSLFRTSPAIEYGAMISDDNEERKELLGYRHKKYYVCLQDDSNTHSGGSKSKDKKKTAIKSFLPKNKNSTNNAVKYIMKSLGYNLEKSKAFLRFLFNIAIEAELIEESPNYPNAYYINSNHYILHSYKNLKYYRCKKCNRLTIYNVNNVCSDANCNGVLEPCDIENDSLLQNNYYRNEYIQRPIEKLICEEHTAQLNADEAKRIQNEFTNGNINFISCSTTFEMGIDLGNLNTVFMRNVPPTPANYAQRAGRSGRRADTSAFVLTFCGNTSHDYTYFSNPEEMILGLVRPPYFEIANEKIMIRHITATALSFYFREKDNIQDFTSIRDFISRDVKTKFLNYIKSKPIKLGNMIDNHLLKNLPLEESFGNFKWIDKIEICESSLNNMVSAVSELMELYHQSEICASQKGKHAEAGYYQSLQKGFNSTNSLITYFTKYNVIPGYGFPVDNVELRIMNSENAKKSEKYNLQRNLAIAISEYAPGSEVIVANKKYTSRYLQLPYNTRSLPKTYYCECDKCHTINTSPSEDELKRMQCKYCTNELNIRNIQSYVTPIYGFVADKKNKDSRRIKPFKTYTSDIYYIGSALNTEINLYDAISVEEYKDEQLLVINENNFYTCRSCGYTILDKNCHDNTITKPEHLDSKGYKCHCNTLFREHLGYSYRTDIVKISFRDNIYDMHDDETAYSVLFAILEGISMAYNIERTDIGGMIYRTVPAKPYSLILYDTVPGGAGHVARLIDEKSLRDVLEKAKIKVSQNCCSEDTSCYNCLRTYNNQKLHKHIKRGKAKKAIEQIMQECTKNRYHIKETPSIKIYSIEDVKTYATEDYMTSESAKVLSILVQQYEDYLNISALSGYGFEIICDTEPTKELWCDFAWLEKHVLLFSQDYEESYIEIRDNLKSYKCFLLSDSFDYKEFIASVE